MRPSKDQYFTDIAKLVASRSTCVRRSVGCIIVDKNYRILSTGHNGVPPGVPHCTNHPCEGAKCPSGTGLDLCQATHAEINALLFCNDITKVEKIYITCAPCIGCAKAILTSACKEVIYLDHYNGGNDGKVQLLLNNRGVSIRQYVTGE